MTITLGIIQFLVIGCILLFEFYNKSSAVFLWATLMLLFGAPHLLSSFSGDANYSDSTLSSASLFVIFFCVFYLFTRIAISGSVLRKNKVYFTYECVKEQVTQEKTSNMVIMLVLAVDIVLKLYPFIKSSGGLLATSMRSGRAYSTSLSYLNSNQITGIVFYSLAGILAYYLIRKEYKLFAVSSLLVLGTVIITRNRIEVLPFLCAVIAIPVFKNKRISIRVVLLGIVAVVFVIYVIYGLWVFRHFDDLGTFIRTFELKEFINQINYNLRFNTKSGELNLRKWFYYFIKNNNDFLNFNRGHSYIRMLLVYIPTRLAFGIKPPDFAISMGTAIGMPPGGSTHPTLFGDCYANLNVFGVVLGSFWASYATVADKITIRQRPLVSILIYMLYSVSYVIIGRGSVYNGFVPVAYGVPILLLFAYMKKHVVISKKSYSNLR